jgi:GT2 family glycosyltransferase
MLQNCLLSLPEAAGCTTYSVHVVDNASIDGSPEMVRTLFPDVHLIANSSNIGFARANNLILKSLASRCALLLNPDTEPYPHSIERLCLFMDAHPDAGACGPKLLNTDGSLQPNGAFFPSLTRDFLAVTGLRRLANKRFEITMVNGRENFDILAQVDQISGACLMVKKEAIDRVGILDDRFFMFAEEVEWCFRLKKAGYNVYYVPDAHVTHHWMASVRQSGKAMNAQLYRSQLLYYQITSGSLKAFIFRFILLLALIKNNCLYFGVAVKQLLRKMKLIAPADP